MLTYKLTIKDAHDPRVPFSVRDAIRSFMNVSYGESFRIRVDRKHYQLEFPLKEEGDVERLLAQLNNSEHLNMFRYHFEQVQL